MTIGFDGSRSFVKHKTGTENYAYQLLKQLAQIDHTNQYIVYLRPGNVIEEWRSELANLRAGELVTQTNKSSDSPIRQSASSLSNCGWPSNFQFKMLNYPRLWTQFGLAKQTFTDKLDVLFVPSHTLPLIRKPGLKSVMTVHDLGAEYLPGMHQLKQQLYLGMMTKIQFESATKLIAVSQSTKNDLVSKIGVSPKLIEVIYEGLNNTSKNSKDIEKKINDIEKQDQISINNKLLYKRRYFLFVGTIQPRKNLVHLIKAYAGFRNVLKVDQRISGSASQLISENTDAPIRQSTSSLPLLVLAGGKGWLSEEIYQLPKKLDIQDNVIFTGRVSDDDLQTLYKHALAFTFPSLFEGFGLPVLEAFAAKIPVITSNSSSLPEIAGNAALLIDPVKTEDILDALLKIYDDEAMRNDLVKKGTEQLKKFSWQKCAQETLKVLEQVVSP